jgi:hypothetical protein
MMNGFRVLDVMRENCSHPWAKSVNRKYTFALRMCNVGHFPLLVLNAQRLRCPGIYLSLNPLYALMT